MVDPELLLSHNTASNNTIHQGKRLYKGVKQFRGAIVVAPRGRRESAFRAVRDHSDGAMEASVGMSFGIDFLVLYRLLGIVR